MAPTPDRPPRALDDALQDFLAAESAGTTPPPGGRAERPRAATPARTPPRGPRPSRGVSLESAYEEVLEHEAEKRRLHLVHVPWWRKALPWAMVLALLATAGWIVVGQPAWLYPPAPAPVPATHAPMARAFLRTAANLVEAYRQEHRRLPLTLAELNAPIPNLEYTPRADGSYVLRTRLGTHVITLEGTADGVAEMRESHQ